MERLLLLMLFVGVWAVEDLNVRLPGSIVAEHYRIKMITVLQEGDFRLVGSLRMDFTVKESTDQVVMHAVNLTVVEDSVNIITLSRGDPRSLSVEELLSIVEESSDSRSDSEPIRSQSVVYDAENEFVIIRLTSPLIENRRYRINFNYRGKLSDGLKGFYRSHYIDRSSNSKRWLAVTQMEPTAARQVFPCLDEPAMKATFEIVIGRSSNMTSLSNMPLSRTEPMRNKDGWFWDYYEKSVPMSTYLVACLISDFEFREASPVTRQIRTNSSDASATSTAVRIWAQRDMIDQTELAVKVTTPMLEFLERYFQVEFPLPKIDLVALPDFSSGAMENWGLITFRETALLVDPKSPAVREEMNVERIIAHELAHQWFGNLVTMKWWNDLWLNEGFATYVQRIVLDSVSPKYQYGTLQCLDFLNILNTDALQSSHPISVEVKHPNQIKEIFDGVSYTKGSAVIRMMNHFLGEPTFRQALTNYLTEKKYNNAEQDELWRFMSEQAHADDVLPHNVDVKAIMDTWTLQMGFPVITVTRNYSTASVSFGQKRFLRTTVNYAVKNLRAEDEPETRQIVKDEPSYLWWVPVSYTDAVERNFDTNNTQPRLWLSPDQVTVTQESGVREESWIMANIQGTGYFRVNYDERNWQLLSGQLLSDHQVIHVLNRAHLISDAFALAAVNTVPYTTPFDLIRYLQKEDHHVPWQSALSALGYVGRMFVHTPHYGRYQAFVSSLVFPAYLRIGVEFKPDDQPMTKFSRISLTAEACNHGHRPCIHQSQDFFEEWMNSPDPITFNGIPADLRYTTYCTAIKYGGALEWDFAFQMVPKVTSSQHRDTLLSALGCSREPWILVRYLSKSMDPDSAIRKQDGRRVVGAVAANPVGRPIAFNFLKKNFDELLPYFTIQRAMQMFSTVTGSFNTAEELQSVEDFMASKADALKTVQSSYKQIVTAIAANVDWMNRNSATLVQWFESKGF